MFRRAEIFSAGECSDDFVSTRGLGKILHVGFAGFNIRTGSRIITVGREKGKRHSYRREPVSVKANERRSPMKHCIVGIVVLFVAVGVALAALCPRCGREVAESAKFCPECGTKLLGASPNDFSGTWKMIENGNEVTLIVRQEGDTITGEFISKDGNHRDRITGKVSTSSDQWKIAKIEFTRVGEINDYVGYMMMHGEEGGPYQYKAMAGSFLRRDLGCNCGWYATRAEPRTKH